MANAILKLKQLPFLEIEEPNVLLFVIQMGGHVPLKNLSQKKKYNVLNDANLFLTYFKTVKHVSKESHVCYLMEEKHDWIEWRQTGYARIPYNQELISHEPGHIVYNGYFYIEDGAMPVERIFLSPRGMFHVEIYEKKTMEDTSEYGPYDEEEGGSICFFPTAIISLHYRILSELITSEEWSSAEERIELLEKEVRIKENQLLEEKRLLYLAEWKKESEERRKNNPS